MTERGKAIRLTQVRLMLARVIDASGGDTAENADLAAAEALLHDWLARLPEDTKEFLRRRFGDQNVP